MSDLSALLIIPCLLPQRLLLLPVVRPALLPPTFRKRGSKELGHLPIPTPIHIHNGALSSELTYVGNDLRSSGEFLYRATDGRLH